MMGQRFESVHLHYIRKTGSNYLNGLTFLTENQNMRGSSVQVRPRLLDVKQFPVDLVVIPNGSRVPLGAFSNMQAAEFDSPTRWVPKRGELKLRRLCAQ